MSTVEKKEGSGTVAEPSVFTDAESKAIAAIAVAIMMSRSSVSATDLHKHFIGLLETFKASREALRETLTWLRQRPAITGDGWPRPERKRTTEIEALLSAALGDA